MSMLSENTKAIMLFLYVLLGNAITIGIVRHISEGFHFFQIFFCVSFVATLCFIPWLIKHGKQKLKTQKRGLLIARAIIEFVAFSASFYAISQIPMPMHTAILFITPIFGTLIALFFLREHGTWVTYGCVAIGFIGMLIISLPGLQSSTLNDGVHFGILVTIIAAMGFACCGTIIKMLTRTESSDSIAFYMLMMTSVISAPFAFANWTMPTPDQAGWLAAMGIIAFSIQNAVAKALSKVPYITVIPLNFAQLVFVSIIAYVVYHEVIDGWTILGSILILAATLYNAYYSSRHAREMAAAEDLAQMDADDDGMPQTAGVIRTVPVEAS